MLSKLKAADFQKNLGQQFEITNGDTKVAVKLAEVSELGQSVREGGSFSLVFDTAEEIGLEQGVYAVSHDTMDAIELFLVPIGPFGDGEGYESIFT